jgi:hypothetical protein
MRSGGGGGDGEASVLLGNLGTMPGLGPVWRRQYVDVEKHGPMRIGRVSRRPRNGQDALDVSVPVKPTSRARVGVDYDDDSLVIFHWHDVGEFRSSMNYEIFHGYVSEWHGLTHDQRNALMRWGFVDLKGRIR